MSAADDEDMGDFWRSVRAERQQKRADNRADNAAMLLAAGLKGYEAGSAAAAHAAWQPIATAPKDGTFVLTWRDHRGGEVLQARYAPTMFGDVCWGGVGWSLPKSCEPSHWMPLPAAPTQGAEGAAPQAVVREASEAVGAQIEALTALADTYVDAGITYQGNPNALTVAALDAARSAFINAARAALAQHQPATLRETK